MRLKDVDLLVRYIEDRDFSQARLGRYAGVSRQFIHKLTTGETRTCSQRVGELIEEALAVLPGTLFALEESPVRRSRVASNATPRGRASTGPGGKPVAGPGAAARAKQKAVA